MIKPAFRALCLSLALTFSYQAAQADVVMFDGFAAQTAMTTMHNSVLQQRYGVKEEQESAEPALTATKPAKASLTFSPSAADTRKNIAKFIKQSQTIDPAAAAQLEAAFAAKDMMGAINQALRKLGLSHTNVADVYAVYWISAWQASQGQTHTPSAATFQAVSAQLSSNLAQSEDFTAMSDAQKQAMSETLLIQALLIDTALEKAAADPEQLKAVGAIVLKGAKENGLALEGMTLTEKGFTLAGF